MTDSRDGQAGFTANELIYVFIVFGAVAAVIALSVCGVHFIRKFW